MKANASLALFFVLFCAACGQGGSEPVLNLPPLHQAVKEDNFEKAKEILFNDCAFNNLSPEGLCLNANERNLDNGQTPLFYARSVKTAKFLIDKGADVFMRDDSNATPLHFAYSPELVKFFLQKGLEVDTKDSHGRTPLYQAILDERFGAARVLFQLGANPREKNNSQESPLKLAEKRAGVTSFSLNRLIKAFKGEYFF